VIDRSRKIFSYVPKGETHRHKKKKRGSFRDQDIAGKEATLGLSLREIVWGSGGADNLLKGREKRENPPP